MTMSGDYAWLCRAYLDGNYDAISLIDTIVACSVDLAYLRENIYVPELLHDKITNEVVDYHDMRQVIDEAIDHRLHNMKALELEPSFVTAEVDRSDW